MIGLRLRVSSFGSIGLRFEFNCIGRDPKLSGTTFEQWFLVDVTLTNQELIHDAAVTDISPYRTVISHGSPTSINATVQNRGDFDRSIQPTN